MTKTKDEDDDDNDKLYALRNEILHKKKFTRIARMISFFFLNLTPAYNIHHKNSTQVHIQLFIFCLVHNIRMMMMIRCSKSPDIISIYLD